MSARHLAGALVVAALIGSAGCGSDSVTSPTSTTTSPVTETWTGIIGPGGTASRSLTSSQLGTITVTLSTADAPLGVGIGVPRTLNGGCRLTVSRVAAAGESVTVAADAGNYCVQLYDEGIVVKQAGFVVQITYP